VRIALEIVAILEGAGPPSSQLTAKSRAGSARTSDHLHGREASAAETAQPGVAHLDQASRVRVPAGRAPERVAALSLALKSFGVG
jgi:hypothetical protein